MNIEAVNENKHLQSLGEIQRSKIIMCNYILKNDSVRKPIQPIRLDSTEEQKHEGSMEA